MGGKSITPHRPSVGSVVLRAVPPTVVHRAPHRLQVRLSGDLDPQRALAAARLVTRATGAPTAIELDLTRVTYLAPEAVEQVRTTLPSALCDGAELIVRVRPGPVTEVVEAAGLAEEDGGPATIVSVRSSVRPPDAATEVVMRFYEALAGRDWLELDALVADEVRPGAKASAAGSELGPAAILGHHARLVAAAPGLRSAIRTTESDGRIVIARGLQVVPAEGTATARPFRHRWQVAGDQVVAFVERRDG